MQEWIQQALNAYYYYSDNTVTGHAIIPPIDISYKLGFYPSWVVSNKQYFMFGLKRLITIAVFNRLLS